MIRSATSTSQSQDNCSCKHRQPLRWLLYARRVLSFLVILALASLLFFLQAESIDILHDLKNLVARYGYISTLFGSLIEGTLGIQWLFPGGITVLLAASQAYPVGPLSIFVIIALGTIGAVIGYVIDFYLGRAGYVNEQFSGYITIFLKSVHWSYLLAILCVHPNFAAPLCWIIGYSRLAFPRFLKTAIAAQFLWSTIWALVGRAYGENAVLFLIEHKRILAIVLVLLYIFPLLVAYVIKPKAGK